MTDPDQNTSGSQTWNKDPKLSELRRHQRAAFQERRSPAEFKAELKAKVQEYEKERDAHIAGGMSSRDADIELSRRKALLKDEARADYSQGTTLGELNRDGWARRHDRLMEETRQSQGGDYFLKVTSRDHNLIETKGYVCRASELEGKTPEEMGRSLGVREWETSPGGVRVHRLGPVPSESLAYRGTSTLPDGGTLAGNRTKPAGNENYPPGFGSPVNQWKLKENVAVTDSIDLAPGQKFERRQFAERSGHGIGPPPRNAPAPQTVSPAPERGRSR